MNENCPKLDGIVLVVLLSTVSCVGDASLLTLIKQNEI